jgi:hypothetical protein
MTGFSSRHPAGYVFASNQPQSFINQPLHLRDNNEQPSTMKELVIQIQIETTDNKA